MTRAARIIAHGQPLQIEEVELPEPRSDEVAVDMAFGGVNPVDGYTAEGKVAPDGPLPRTLGGEGSGYLDGKPVIVAGAGLGAERDGVWAERVVVPRAAVVDVPEGTDMQVAAAMGVAGLTAWNVVHLAGVGPGDRVVVLGAAGGVGLPIVSLASSLGAEVWGQTGDEAKAEAIRRQGAARAIVTDAAGLADALAPLDPTVVIDSLGGGFTTAALVALATGGRHVVFGTSAGGEVSFNLQSVYRKSQRLLGYGGIGLSQDQRRQGLTDALAAVADGKLQIVVDRALPLEQVNEAFGALHDRSVTGKVILAM